MCGWAGRVYSSEPSRMSVYDESLPETAEGITYTHGISSHTLQLVRQAAVLQLHRRSWRTETMTVTTPRTASSTLTHISFNSTWLLKRKKKNYLSLFQNLHLSLLPLLACTYLNNAWDLVLLALPLYVCLFKINRFMYSPIVSRFG